MNRPRPLQPKETPKGMKPKAPRVAGPTPVQAPGPYPAIAVRGPDMQMARLLSQDLAYSKGEMSAVHLYLYQHWILSATRGEIAETLLRIAQVEMHHMNILGQLIRLLGADPRFCAAQQGGSQYWISGMIPYHRDARRILQTDIAAERDAADIYASQARYARDPGVSAILARLAEDEKVHHHLFEQFFISLD